MEFLCRNRDRAVVEWERAVLRLTPAAGRDRTGLRDHIPRMLDRIIEAVQTGNTPTDTAVPEEHVRMRLDQGYSLEEIAQEYQILRSVIHRLMQTHAAPLEVGAIVLLNEAIDAAIQQALSRYHRTRSRTLGALERISQEAFASAGEDLPDLADLLRRLLSVILKMTEAVDVGIIFLREWDRLVVRAVAGLDSPLVDEGHFALRVGEGVAGTVAAQRQPYFTGSASTDPLVKEPAVAMAGVKALYAVPLVYGEDVIGVAQMASRTASTFCQDDRQLFGDMAQRAAVVIAHRRLATERAIFLGVLSHDLRSPLNTIVIGANYLGKSERLSEAGTRALQRIAMAAQRMDRLIGDLADFTKVRFGAGLTVERRVNDFGSTVRKLTEELRSQCADREITLDCRGDLVGEWDHIRLGQVVTNLVTNALSYGTPGSAVAVSVDGSDDESLSISVHNEGPPIPVGLVPQLFEPFRRGQAQGVGMGLGLYIVQHVALAHSGTITVESTGQEGTTFTIRIPRWTACAGGSMAPPSRAGDGPERAVDAAERLHLAGNSGR